MELQPEINCLLFSNSFIKSFRIFQFTHLKCIECIQQPNINLSLIFLALSRLIYISLHKRIAFCPKCYKKGSIYVTSYKYISPFHRTCLSTRSHELNFATVNWNVMRKDQISGILCAAHHISDDWDMMIEYLRWFEYDDWISQRIWMWWLSISDSKCGALQLLRRCQGKKLMLTTGWVWRVCSLYKQSAPR